MIKRLLKQSIIYEGYEQIIIRILMHYSLTSRLINYIINLTIKNVFTDSIEFSSINIDKSIYKEFK